ncbi:MAG: TetR/AcrR family transcriptional regulator [Pseudomonadota bacterium]|nr:TetR/AcrR family transcriptional regulator [Pseudomonadota bacterium]
MPQPQENADISPTTDGRLARGEATRERVLDAAELCFAAKGFEAVSIRQIAAEAEVTLGVVGFHGGSKEELFMTVFSRRAATLHDLRMAALRNLIARGDMQLRDIVDAYLTPYLDIASRGDPQWRAYAQLVAREVARDRFSDGIRELYDPTARAFIAQIKTLHPSADATALATVLTLTVASMLSIVASQSRIAGLSDGPASERPMDYREMLIDFCTGGIQQALGKG